MPFITSKDNKWKEMLQSVEHDFYHKPDYTVLEAKLLAGKPIAWWTELHGNCYLIPLVQRQVDSTTCYDLVSPYGYPGILSNNRMNHGIAGMVLDQFNQEAIEGGFVSSFIRLNPFNNNWNFNQAEHQFDHTFRQVIHGKTVSINLKPSLESIRDNFSENHKRNLKKLTIQGYKLTINDWSLLDAFIDAYRQTMIRKSALPYYFFPDFYFEELRKILGHKLILITITDSKEKLLAGGLFTLEGKIMQYHLGATANEVVRFSPSKLMMDAAIVYGKDKRASLLHVGGGFSASTSDGLFRFKKGFGSDFHSFSTLRFIHDLEVYNQLIGGKEIADTEFFPAYRTFGMRKV